MVFPLELPSALACSPVLCHFRPRGVGPEPGTGCVSTAERSRGLALWHESRPLTSLIVRSRAELCGQACSLRPRINPEPLKLCLACRGACLLNEQMWWAAGVEVPEGFSFGPSWPASRCGPGHRWVLGWN